MASIGSAGGVTNSKSLAKIAALMANRGELNGVRLISESTWSKAMNLGKVSRMAITFLTRVDVKMVLVMAIMKNKHIDLFLRKFKLILQILHGPSFKSAYNYVGPKSLVDKICRAICRAKVFWKARIYGSAVI